MYHLRLCKGLSYMGIVSATQDAPDVYVAEEAQAKSLAASGYFEMLGELNEIVVNEPVALPDKELEPAADLFEVEEPEPVVPELVDLQKKTKAELIDYADQSGIDITGCKTKDEIYQKIVEAFAQAAAARATLREE